MEAIVFIVFGEVSFGTFCLLQRIFSLKWQRTKKIKLPSHMWIWECERIHKKSVCRFTINMRKRNVWNVSLMRINVINTCCFGEDWKSCRCQNIRKRLFGPQGNVCQGPVDWQSLTIRHDFIGSCTSQTSSRVAKKVNRDWCSAISLSKLNWKRFFVLIFLLFERIWRGKRWKERKV